MSCNNDTAYEDVFKLGTKEAIVFAATAYILRDRKLCADFQNTFGISVKKAQQNELSEAQQKWLWRTVNKVLESCKITIEDC